MSESDLAVFDPVKAEIAKYKAMNEEIIFDYEDPQDNKDARSHIFALRKIKTKIAGIHKTAKAEALVFCKKLDGKKREYTSDVEEMISVHATPIKEIEQREEQERLAKIEAERVAKEEAERKRLEAIAAHEAVLAKKEAELKAKEDAINAEQERVRLEAEYIERERRFAKEAAETARKQAEDKAESERVAREQVVAREKAEAEARVRAAESARLAKEAAKQAEEKRLAEIERKRVANKEHRLQIELFAIDQIELLLTGHNDAQNIVEAISNGAIDNVTINY